MACLDNFQGPTYGNGCDAIPDMQADMATLIDINCTDCFGTVTAGTDPKDFVDDGFSGTLPDEDTCKFVYIIEDDCIIWIAVNDATNCDLGDGTPGTGQDWTKIVESTSAVGDSYIKIEDVKATNTQGGTATSGAMRVRDLNTIIHNDNNYASMIRLAFTSGGTYEIVRGDIITGATSTETAEIVDVDLTSGSWAGGDAAGDLWIVDQSGAFVAENLDVGANSNVATIAGDSTAVTDGFWLAPGTFDGRGRVPAWSVNGHNGEFYNSTDSTVVATGQSAYSNSGAMSYSHIEIPPFTIAVGKKFQLRHEVNTTRSTNGFGDCDQCWLTI